LDLKDKKEYKFTLQTIWVKYIDWWKYNAFITSQVDRGQREKIINLKFDGVYSYCKLKLTFVSYKIRSDGVSYNKTHWFQ